VEELDGLTAHRLEVKRQEPEADLHWKLELRHPQWGTAQVFAPRDVPLPPQELIDWDPRLSREEKKEIAAAYGSSVWVHAEAKTRDVLRDRKALLRFLSAVMGSRGLVGEDHLAQSFWSRSALEDELHHDAPLDVSALFTIHIVGDEGKDPYWLHSHGLKEIGFVDFDILAPHPSCHRVGYDALRALAFAIAEGQLVADSGPQELVRPGGTVQLVSARRFRSRVPADQWALWRQAVDDQHLEGHAIVCDPARRSWLGLGARPPRPSRFFSREFPDEGLIQFSNQASALMAERARNTYPVFRALREELAEFSLPAMIKLGYVVDGGSDNDREHLWFEVHDCRDGEVDATLVNQPFHIERMKAGDRGQHSMDLVSDWAILSPFGSITPAFGKALRDARTRKDELRRVLDEARRAQRATTGER
jgi:uncharacterized protein YegJ (DUF2314 family)